MTAAPCSGERENTTATRGRPTSRIVRYNSLHHARTRWVRRVCGGLRSESFSYGDIIDTGANAIVRAPSTDWICRFGRAFAHHRRLAWSHKPVDGEVER